MLLLFILIISLLGNLNLRKQSNIKINISVQDFDQKLVYYMEKL